MSVSEADAARAKRSMDGARVDVVTVPNSGEGLAILVEQDGVVDLVRVQTLAAHGDALPTQVKGYGVPVDPEPFRQLVDRGSRDVLLGEQGGFLARELPDD